MVTTDRYFELRSRKANRGMGSRKSELLEQYRITAGARQLAFIYDPENRIPELTAELESIEAELMQITH